jgi:lipid-binding SYLF domain-containing protein
MSFYRGADGGGAVIGTDRHANAELARYSLRKPAGEPRQLCLIVRRTRTQAWQRCWRCLQEGILQEGILQEGILERRDFLTRSTATLVSLTLIGGCSSPPQTPAENVAKKREIDAGVNETLTRLYARTPDARELVQKARGVLVFPSVLSAGIGVGGEYGEGELRSGGRTVGYYKTETGSLGATLGVQTKAVVFLFMTEPAYQQFLSGSGWTAGADAAVAVAKVGADGSIDSKTVREPIIGFVLTNSGLMFNLSLNGTKVSKLDI